MTYRLALAYSSPRGVDPELDREFARIVRRPSDDEGFRAEEDAVARIPAAARVPLGRSLGWSFGERAEARRVYERLRRSSLPFHDLTVWRYGSLRPTSRTARTKHDERGRMTRWEGSRGALGSSCRVRSEEASA